MIAVRRRARPPSTASGEERFDVSTRYRTNLVLKLFPSIPKGLFGSGRLGTRLTAFLERRVFYREFQVAPWKAAFVAASVAALALWAVVALALAGHALVRAERMRAEVAERERDLAEQREALVAARRDYHLLLSRLTPLNEKVDRLSQFSQRMAMVAGVDSLAEELGSTADQRRLDLRLSEDEIAALDRRFEQLGTFVENQEFELSRTPSISPLKDAFVPTDRFGYRMNRFLRQSAEARGGDGRQFHAGLDLAAPVGTPIYATADGTVHFAGSIPPKQDPGASFYGNFVVLDHGNGMRTVYAHCDALAVRAGDEVRRGEPIAWVGSTGRSTGPHLHYEVVAHGRPMDPELFIFDLNLPAKRVRVEFDDPSPLIESVDRLLGQRG